MKKNFKENEELDIIVLIEKIKLMLLSLFLQIFRRSKSFLLGCFLFEGLSKMLNLSPTFSATGILK